MTQDQRRRRPEHHVVHDYANLVSAGKMVISGKHLDVDLLSIAPANSHIEHAFYTYCRDMYEFFQYKPKAGYRRAGEFLATEVQFVFTHFTQGIREHMETHLLHSGKARTEREIVWKGNDNALYLADFEGAWEVFLRNLKDENRATFKDEIQFRLNSEFSHCGDLGLRFIG